MADATAERRTEGAITEAVRDLVLVLADSKRLLGMRYADWILGSPELEAGIACASMAQDEWGHARLLYSILKDFGDDVDHLEHERTARDYRNMMVLDAPPAKWPEVVVLNAFADAALTVQLEALRGSSEAVLRQRVEKMLEEERYHAIHASAWFSRIAGAGDPARDALVDAVDRGFPTLLQWFGPEGERAESLRAAGVVQDAGDALRKRYMERVSPLLEQVGRARADGWGELDFAAFDEASRRSGGEGPDEETLLKVRGDKNRAFLVE